jgi:putative endonuclease
VNHKAFGSSGEEHAAEYLVNIGYIICERNFRVRGGELDIIAKDPQGTLVFVEVKTSRGVQAGTPQEWVTLKKQQQIYRIAHKYCAIQGIEDAPMRFDVIGIQIDQDSKTQITHYENAFIPLRN